MFLVRILSLRLSITSKLIRNQLLMKAYCNSNHDDDEPEVFTGPIPRDKLRVKFSRSSGPGGQNVNKLNTKAEVRFHVNEADWLPQRVKDRIHKLYKNKINVNGEMVMSSTIYRTQYQNLNDVIERLEGLLVEASQIPQGPSELTLARIKELKRKAERRRLTEKKYRSLKKREKRID